MTSSSSSSSPVSASPRSPIFLSGLPRSGTTLLSNLLAQHSQLAVTPTSPLYALFEKLRTAWSSDPALLAQLDGDYDAVYARLIRSTRAFIDAWCADVDAGVDVNANVDANAKANTNANADADFSAGGEGGRITVDKHRGWLFCLETLRVLYPGFKMIVCVRDLRDVYASLERQHRKTLMLRFPDETEQNLVEPRAAQFFSASGVIGGVLRALRNLGDIPDPSAHLCIVRYESLIADPEATLGQLVEQLGLRAERFDLERVRQMTHEADSYYHFKFPHTIKGAVRAAPVDRRDLSPRVLATIVDQYGWFYRAFYGPRTGVDLSALQASTAATRPAETPELARV
jgi:sulfotransferase